MAKWFKSYLTDREQKIETKSPYATHCTYSHWGTIEHGILQGSILGLLLFIIYINDLQPIINTLAAPTAFADDTSVIISNKNLDERFEVFTVVTMKMVSSGMLCHVALVRTEVPPKRQFLQEPHGVTSKKTPFFKNLDEFVYYQSCISYG
jgi:hypothetical protein